MTQPLRFVKIHNQRELSLQHMSALRREVGWDEEFVGMWIDKSRDGRANFVLAYAEGTIADEYSNLVGMVGVTWDTDTPIDPAFANRDEGIIQLTSLAIAKRWQGKGLGKAMMDAAETMAGECGAIKIVSVTRTIDYGSNKLHERAGFRISGTVMRSWTTAEHPALFWEKLLV
ncbi:acyl-CoA N-acyltransferase [Cladochytrium replicatum]|nr:acyl-CoA N-acyltransferase [Cladochytrium replicatum]